MPALTSEEILGLVKQTRWGEGPRGRIRALLRFKADGLGAPERRRFLEEMLTIPVPDRPTYVHPEHAARPGYRRDGGADDLTPAELLWLQRLPLDPAEVTHDDAARLAALNNSLDASKSPSSKHLVASIWTPVKEIHDARLAQQQLQLLKAGPHPLPESAHGALIEALQQEHQDWPAEGLSGEARRRLTDALDARARAHAGEIAIAQDTIDQVEASRTQRTAVIRDAE